MSADMGPEGEGSLELDIAEIKRLIPHRYPFLLVDRLVDVRLGESATGIKNVTINEPFFPGHFPSHPVMPGVLIVEAMAQTAAVLVVRGLDVADDHGMIVYFMGIDKARFRQPVEPGDRLELAVRVLKGREKVWRFTGEARTANGVCAEAEFMAMLVRPEDTAAKQRP